MSENKISRLVPRNQKVFVACLIMLSAIDSVVSIECFQAWRAFVTNATAACGI